MNDYSLGFSAPSTRQSQGSVASPLNQLGAVVVTRSAQAIAAAPSCIRRRAVSYTHLTLPTSDLV